MTSSGSSNESYDGNNSQLVSRWIRLCEMKLTMEGL